MPAAPPTDHVQRCQLCAARLTCLIGRLPPAQQERLDPMLRELGFRKGEVLQSEGIAAGVVRTVKLGTVMLTRTGPDGAQHPVAMVGRGHLLGMWGLLGKPTQVGAQALSAGRVCEMPVAALRHTLHQDAALMDILHHHMANAFSLLADWSQVMRLRGLPRQLAASMLLLAQQQGTRTVLLPSQVALAALLSTSRESVARTLARLELDGHVRRIDRWHAELGADLPAVFEKTEKSP